MSTPDVDPRCREVLIVMDDGVRLSATLYLPERDDGPQPCILEALPYRKDDLTSSYRPDYVRFRDDHGYAVCRLDLRGTGSSGGDATDEYPAREQQDLHQVIDWLANQDWCDGNVGMYGTSYSGFNSLQMACERPEHLKAIIAIYGTDDRYTDDVHYRGGILKLLDLVDYCHYMTPMNVLPPVPAIWGDGWRDEWVRRIETSEPWALTWLREQLDGPYWRHGSVRPGYERIACPTMIIAGWADGYRNNSFRTIERLRAQGVPHRLLAGPWSHASTDTALPGPRIDSMPEMVAWWDRWLRGIDNGVDDGVSAERPAVTCFVRSSTRPSPVLDESAGFWIREEWPSPRVEVVSRDLAARAAHDVRPDVGVDAWIDCAGHLPWGQSADQRFDDAASVVWEWDADSVTLVGHPRARLRISVDQPTAYVSVKVCDVFPDGTSALVSRGTLNLGCRDGLDRLVPLEPGQVYDVEVELEACAYAFDPGQRLRLSLAGSDWPNTAAPPRPVTITVPGGELDLPVWTGPSPFAEPDLAPGRTGGEDPTGLTWSVERDVLAGTTSCVVDHGSTYEIPYGGTATEHYEGLVCVEHATFEQRSTATTTFTIRWPDVEVSTTATMEVLIGADAFDVSIEVTAREATEDGFSTVGARQWKQRLPRLA
ncbi:MAG TPA: CocE/NonD family hydrolase [Nocardioidaceae bacterium]